MFRYLLAYVCLLLAFDSSAQSLILKASGHTSVNGHLLYLRDSSNQLSIDQVQPKKFLPVDVNKSPNFGFDRKAYWFKLTVSNQSDEKEWLLEASYSPLDRIDFYTQSDTGSTFIHKVAGDNFPIKIRDIRHRHSVFTFNVLPGESKNIYLRIKTTSSVQVPLHLWHNKAFTWASFKVQLLNGLFYGAMLIMVLYQLFLFFFVRDKITLYYVFTLLAMANILSFFQGYSFLFFYPDNPLFNDFLALFSGPIFILFSTLLTREFLSLRQFSRWLDRLLLFNMMLDMVATFVMIIFTHQISYKYHHYFLLSHCVIVLVTSAYCLYLKYRPALYYLLAWATLLITASVFTLSSLGLVPGYMSTNYSGVMLGCILQVLLISLALGERWNVLTKENQEAKERELKRGLEENERLEREVKVRTEEILKQKEKLEESNRIKDKLFSVVSHDIKSPLNSLKIALLLTHSGKISPDEFRDVTNGLENHLAKTTEFIQNLLQWAKLQLNGESFDPVRVDLREIANETYSIIELEIQQKMIEVKMDIPDVPCFAHADAAMIRSVFRNLLTNAVKFTPSNGTIVIGIKKESTQFVVSVSDTGVGIPLAHQSNLFTLESITTLGTQQEAGTGLGLVLCKEFVEKNNGQIWFNTIEGKGTTFYFSLLQFHNEHEPSFINLATH
jgi:signal transduction histidine kinase